MSSERTDFAALLDDIQAQSDALVQQAEKNVTALEAARNAIAFRQGRDSFAASLTGVMAIEEDFLAVGFAEPLSNFRATSKR